LSTMTDNPHDQAAMILLTRPQSGSERFGAALRAQIPEAEILISPLIDIEYICPPPNIAAYGGIVFTSVHGVELFQNHDVPEHMPCFAVGPRTAQAASDAGFLVEKSNGNSAALVKMILSHPNLGQLLHVHGEHTRGEVAKQLSQSGCPCESMVVYAQTAKLLSSRVIKTVQGGNPLILPLFSPRTAILLLEQMTPTAGSHIVAMSKSVAEPFYKFDQLGMTVVDVPRSDKMLRAVCNAYKAT
jgi:uroporphyrinogen-III synthase